MANDLFIITLFVLLPIVGSIPVLNGQAGPCIGMDCMHGVLMHNDGAMGDDHRNEDTYNRLKEMDEGKEERGPCKGGDCLHGILMHGDSEMGEDHSEEDHAGNIGPEEEKAPQGPCQGMDCMHGVLMHNDQDQGKDHTREHANEVDKKDLVDTPDSPCIDCVMHGHTGDGHQHGDDDGHVEEIKNENHDVDIHAMLHGGDEDGDVHFKPAKRNDDGDEANGVPGVGDLHAMIHGDMDVNLGQVPDHEKDDYSQWEQEVKDSDNDNSALGYTFAFISDSILNELDAVKKRYLSGFWNDDEQPQVEQDRRFEKPTEGGDTDLRHDLNGVGHSGKVKDDHGHGQPRSTENRRRAHDEG